MGQAQINVRTRACSRTSIARTRPAALTHNVRGKELMHILKCILRIRDGILFCGILSCGILSGYRISTMHSIQHNLFTGEVYIERLLATMETNCDRGLHQMINKSLGSILK